MGTYISRVTGQPDQGSATATIAALSSTLYDKMKLLTQQLGILHGDTKHRILILGLDNAGKTTLIRRMCGEDASTPPPPTIGFNLRSIEHDHVKCEVWDLGGQTRGRQLWSCYYGETHAVIFVVDATDTRKRLMTAESEFRSLVTHDLLRDAVFLVFLNKSDVDGAMRIDEFVDLWRLCDHKDTTWTVAPCSALTGDGVAAGLHNMALAVEHLYQVRSAAASAPSPPVQQPAQQDAPQTTEGTSSRSGSIASGAS